MGWCWPQVQRWEKPRPHILVGLEDTVLKPLLSLMEVD